MNTSIIIVHIRGNVEFDEFTQRIQIGQNITGAFVALLRSTRHFDYYAHTRKNMWFAGDYIGDYVNRNSDRPEFRAKVITFEEWKLLKDLEI